MYNTPPSGHECDRVSHCMYNLHTSLDYRRKFMLVTRLFNFRHKLADSEELATRLLTAVDPEFIYLLLRSSTIFKIIALELSDMLITSRKSAKHMRKIVVYITDILQSNACRSEFVSDRSTKDISDRMGESEIVWARLIYQSLVCLGKVSQYLGDDYIFSYTTTVLELNESLEYLLSDMFDVSLQTEVGSKGAEPFAVNPKGPGEADTSCSLCELLRKGDFKEEAVALEDLYRDLDSLAKAHLDELDLNDQEHEPGGEARGVLLEVLNRLLDSFLSDVKNRRDEVCLDLSSIELVFTLLPREHKKGCVQKCLESNNFDLLKTLMHSVQSSNGRTNGSPRPESEEKELGDLTSALYRHCIGVVTSNLTRQNMLHVLNFIKHSIPNLPFGSGWNYGDLLTVVKRCEIEIYLSLDEVFRLKEPLVASVAFETMEKVMAKVSEVEEPFDSMDELFAVFHRTVQLLFDFLENLHELYAGGVSSALESYKVYVLRLLGCWMTLEPTYYRNQFLDKLEMILGLTTELDFIWLLPAFNYIDVADLYHMGSLSRTLLNLMLKMTEYDYRGQISGNTVRMTCNLVRRMHLDPMVDYHRMLLALGSKGIGAFERGLCPKLEGDLDLKEYLREAHVFTPSYPVDFLAPICVHVDDKNSGPYVAFSSAALKLLFKVVEGADISFAKEGLEGRFDLDSFQHHLKKELEFDSVELVSYATLAAVSASMSRVYESSFLKHYGTRMMVLLMELLVFFFVHTSPRHPHEYLEETTKLEHYFALSKLAVLMMQNYPTFLKLFSHSLKQTNLRVPAPPKEDFRSLIEEGLALEEDLVLSEFFALYTSRV